MENFRRAIGLRIKEVKEVYEGEVRRSAWRAGQASSFPLPRLTLSPAFR